MSAQDETISEFAAFWTRIYPETLPAGWMMRHAGVRWWVRFHSLPLSKRYAETDEEWAILLARQNELASEVLGEGQPCWLAQAEWVVPDGEGKASIMDLRSRKARQHGIEHAFTALRHDEDGDPVTWEVSAAPVRWARGAFDDVLADIADDKHPRPLWASATDGAVFAPYDGGVDLFLPSLAARDTLRSRHADWLPARPLGL